MAIGEPAEPGSSMEKQPHGASCVGMFDEEMREQGVREELIEGCRKKAGLSLLSARREESEPLNFDFSQRQHRYSYLSIRPIYIVPADDGREDFLIHREFRSPASAVSNLQLDQPTRCKVTNPQSPGGGHRTHTQP